MSQPMQPEETGEADAPGRSLSEDDKRRRAKRNLALGGAIAAFVILIYLITVVRMGGAIMERPL